MLREISELTIKLVPQAKAIAWRYFSRAPHALNRDELESIAFEGLMQAANAWEDYCERNDYNPLGDGLKYFGAYASRRMNGAVLDHLRGVDWVTRSTRQKAKKLQAVQDERPNLTRAQVLAEAEMTEDQARRTEAAIAARPVSLDAGEHDVVDGRDVESYSAVVLASLEAVSRCRWQLPVAAQVVLALHYYEQLSLDEIATALEMPLVQVSALHDAGIREVWEAMHAAVA